MAADRSFVADVTGLVEPHTPIGAPRTRIEPGLRLLAGGLVLGVMLVAFETTAVITALPTITDELGGDSLYGVALAAYTLANMVSIVAAGRMADRRGPRPVFLVSVCVFVVGLVVASVAPNMAIVVLGRTLQGTGGGGFGPIAYQIVKRAFPPDRQATMYVYLSAGWVLPSFIGPAFGGIVTDRFGWRWVFAGIIPLALAVGTITSTQLRRFGPTSATDDPLQLAADRRQIATATMAALGVAVFVVGLRYADWWAVVVSAGVGGVVAVRALRQLLPVGVLRAVHGQPATLLCRLLATSMFMGVDGFIPLAADRIHGASPMAQGFTIIGAALTWTGGQALVARQPNVRPHRAIRLGFVIGAFGALLSLPVLWAGWPLWATFLGWSVGGLGMGILYNPATVAAMSYATEGNEGDTSGQMQLVDSLGFSLMGGVGGAVVAFSDRTSFALRDAIGVCFALAIACALLGVFVARGVRSATP